jgi:uncharacterized protein YodC (DUF2158 family)
MEFKVGDTVKLKSGSPKMTVTGVGDNYGVPTVWVAWFDQQMKPQTGSYPAGALEKWS